MTTQLQVAQRIAQNCEREGNARRDWTALTAGPPWHRQAAAERLVISALLSTPWYFHLENAEDIKGAGHLLCLLATEEGRADAQARRLQAEQETQAEQAAQA